MLSYKELPENLQRVNTRHINSVDKFFRMFGGIATHLTALEGGVFELESHVSEQRELDGIEEMARKLAYSWHRNPELADCHTCRVKIYRTKQPTGFAIPARNEDTSGPADFESFKKKVREMFRQMRAAEDLPVVLIRECVIALSPIENTTNLNTPHQP